MSGESRNAFKQILINVLDVNDEKPVFENFPQSCILITEFHEPMETVFVVKAVDKDDPNTPNGKVKFDIVQGNTQGMIIIPTYITIIWILCTKLLVGTYLYFKSVRNVLH